MLRRRSYSVALAQTRYGDGFLPEHAANRDSAERLEQVVDKFGIHNFCASNRSVCHSATLENNRQH